MVSIATRAGLIEVFEASETSLKKPAKAKPKKRAKQPAPAAVHVAARQKPAVVPRAVMPAVPRTVMPAVPRTVMPAVPRTVMPAVPRTVMPAVPRTVAKPRAPVAVAQPARAGAIRPHANARSYVGSSWGRASWGAYSGDDRAVLALLLLPFLAVALSLSTGQARRTGPTALPDIAIRAPVQPTPARSAAIPPPAIPATTITAPPISTPPFSASGQIAYPPPQPEITVASLDVRPVPVPPQPAAPVEQMVEMTAPGAALIYPPPVADVTIAGLDMRPPAPLTAPPPQAAAEQACLPTGAQLAAFSSVGRLARARRQPLLAGVDAETFGRRLSDAAVAQSRDLVIYTARYQPMAYPMGDVVPLHGACIDVIIRAYRVLGIDLQEEVQKARGRRGDPNIDHRRTENMRKFLATQGASLPITNFPEDYKPGDIVTYHRPFSRISTSHIAVVTDVLAPTGRPMIVHNRGYGAQLEDALFVDRITGHYRYMGPTGTPAKSAASSSSATAPDAPVVRASLPSRQARAQQPTPVAAELFSTAAPRPR